TLTTGIHFVITVQRAIDCLLVALRPVSDQTVIDFVVGSRVISVTQVKRNITTVHFADGLCNRGGPIQTRGPIPKDGDLRVVLYGFRSAGRIDPGSLVGFEYSFPRHTQPADQIFITELNLHHPRAVEIASLCVYGGGSTHGLNFARCFT